MAFSAEEIRAAASAPARLADLVKLQHELIHVLRWPGPVDEAKVAELDQKIADLFDRIPEGVL